MGKLRLPARETSRTYHKVADKAPRALARGGDPRAHMTKAGGGQSHDDHGRFA